MTHVVHGLLDFWSICERRERNSSILRRAKIADDRSGSSLSGRRQCPPMAVAFRQSEIA